MEINNIFLNKDIIDIIYQLLSFHTKIIFCQINRYTYQKNECIKYEIYKCINNDYCIFKKCFQRYTYSKIELLKLGIIAIQDIQTISRPFGSGHCKYFDLRYLFELIFHGLDIHNKDIIIHERKNLTYIINKIKSCISFNRFETIQNINKEVSLYPLHTLFKPRINCWIYI